MANPLTLFRKFGEQFQSQWQEHNYGQDMMRRYGPDWRETLASQEETRRFNRAKTAADTARIFQTERKAAADATKTEMSNLEQIIDWEADAYESEEVFGLDESAEGYEDKYKFVREAAGERRRANAFTEANKAAETIVSEGNLSTRRMEQALNAGSPQLLEKAGLNREEIEDIEARQRVVDRTALVDLQDKEVELMLDNVRLKRDQVALDYGMSIEDEEDRARFFMNQKSDDEKLIFSSSMWNTLVERRTNELAIENGRPVGSISGIPQATPEDQIQAVREIAKLAREVQKSGAGSAGKTEDVSQQDYLNMFRDPEGMLEDPLQNEQGAEQRRRANPENVLSAGGTGGHISRQRTLAEHGGVSTEESFRDVPHGQLDESVIAHLEDIVNKGGKIPKWGLDYLASIQRK